MKIKFAIVIFFHPPEHGLSDTALFQAMYPTKAQEQIRRRAWLQEGCGYSSHEGPG